MRCAIAPQKHHTAEGNPKNVNARTHSKKAKGGEKTSTEKRKEGEESIPHVGNIDKRPQRKAKSTRGGHSKPK